MLQENTTRMWSQAELVELINLIAKERELDRVAKANMYFQKEKPGLDHPDIRLQPYAVTHILTHQETNFYTGVDWSQKFEEAKLYGTVEEIMAAFNVDF